MAAGAANRQRPARAHFVATAVEPSGVVAASVVGVVAGIRHIHGGGFDANAIVEFLLCARQRAGGECLDVCLVAGVFV